jgi:hypothetical protein
LGRTWKYIAGEVAEDRLQNSGDMRREIGGAVARVTDEKILQTLIQLPGKIG